jgi:protein-tyrosine phosphatase
VNTTITDRTVVLDLAYNARHLGGLPANGHGETRAFDIVRSGNLEKLTDHGIDALRQQGVTTIVDFRSGHEIEQHPTPDVTRHGMAVLHAPVYERDASPVGLSEQKFPGFGVVYERFLDVGAPAYRRLAETIAETSGGVLFHCAVGKDRTGVAAALLLDLAGVDEETILDDYCHSESELHPLIDGFREQWKGPDMDEALLGALLAAPLADMQSTLSLVRERWGSAEGYFEHIGVSRASVSALRARIAG